MVVVLCMVVIEIVLCSMVIIAVDNNKDWVIIIVVRILADMDMLPKDRQQVAILQFNFIEVEVEV